MLSLLGGTFEGCSICQLLKTCQPMRLRGRADPKSTKMRRFRFKQEVSGSHDIAILHYNVYRMERKPNRTKQIVIRLTAQEHRNIVEAAGFANRTVSDWSRVVMNEFADYEIKRVFDPDDSQELRKRIIDRMFRR